MPNLKCASLRKYFFVWPHITYNSSCSLKGMVFFSEVSCITFEKTLVCDAPDAEYGRRLSLLLWTSSSLTEWGPESWGKPEQVKEERITKWSESKNFTIKILIGNLGRAHLNPERSEDTNDTEISSEKYATFIAKMSGRVEEINKYLLHCKNIKKSYSQKLLRRPIPGRIWNLYFCCP